MLIIDDNINFPDILKIISLLFLIFYLVDGFLILAFHNLIKYSWCENFIKIFTPKGLLTLIIICIIIIIFKYLPYNIIQDSYIATFCISTINVYVTLMMCNTFISKKDIIDNYISTNQLPLKGSSLWLKSRL